MESKAKELIKKKQQYVLLGALAVLGVVLIGIGNSTDDIGSQTSIADTQITVDEQQLESPDTMNTMEQKLARTLSQIQDAGTVTVQITVKNTGRKEYAADTQHTVRTTIDENGDAYQKTTEEQTQSTIVQQNKSGVQQPLLIDTQAPEIVGVLVVASGAKHAAVQEQLLHAVSALLQVPIHQIAVVPGEERT